VALGVLGRLRPRIFSTFGTTRVVGHQPNALAAFTPGEIPGTHFQRLSRPHGTWFHRKEPQKKSQVTPLGIDPGTIRLVAQRLNHYATPGPSLRKLYININGTQHSFTEIPNFRRYRVTHTCSTIPSFRWYRATHVLNNSHLQMVQSNICTQQFPPSDSTE
jgi:hypothetical protein